MATIKFWSEMTKATTVDGEDKVMIGRNATGEAMYADFQYLINQAGMNSSDYIPVDGNTLPDGGEGNKVTFAAPGTYTQSGGDDVVVPENSLGIIVWDGDEWVLGSVVTVPVPVGTDTIDPEGEDLPKEKAVARYSPSKEAVGIYQYLSGENILKNLTESSINDESIWTNGFVSKNTGLEGESITQLRRTDFIPISYPGDISFDYRFVLQGNAGVCFYDENQVFISSIGTEMPTATIVEGVFDVTTEMKFIRVSHSINSNTNHILFSYEKDTEITTSDVFIKSTDREDIESDSAEKAKDLVLSETPLLSDVGVVLVKEGDNAIQQVTDSDFTDSMWNDGFLHKDDGLPREHGIYKYTNPQPIKGGVSFSYMFYFTGNAGVCFYDKDGNFLSSISNPNTSFEFEGEYITPVDAVSVAITQSSNRNPTWSQMISNSEYRMPTSNVFQLADEGGSKFIKEVLDIYSKVKPTRPIVSFISDDAHVNNDWYIGVLNEYSVKSTFAVITGRMGEDYPDYFSAEQVKTILLDGGHDIAGHTVDHDTDNRLNEIDEEQMNIQIGGCYMQLKQLDNRIRPTNFISPWGARNSITDKVVNHYFDHNYITVSSSLLPDGNVINNPPIDSLVMKRVSFDTLNGAQGQSNIDMLKSVVDRLDNEGGWLVFAIHPQYAEYQVSNPVDRRQELRDLINYILGKSIPILTASQAADYYDNIKIGDRRVDPKYHEIGINGTSIGNLF